MRFAGAVWRALHATHPILRAAIGIAVALFGRAWLHRAAFAADPLAHSADRFLGWCAVVLGVYLAIPGVWILARELWNGQGPPRYVREQNAFGAAGRTTAAQIQKLTSDETDAPRPKFLD